MINLGIKLNDTVEKALRHHRRRKHREEIFNAIEDEITALRLQGLNHNEDVHLWKTGENNYNTNFSSKETWKLIRVEQVKVDWCKGIWFPYNTPRFSFMAWIAVQNRLPTGDKMLSWNTAATTACCLCPEPLETRNHLFYKCTFSEEVWKNLTHKLLSRQYTNEWEEIIKTLTGQASSTRLFLIRYVFQSTLSAIWKERNGRKHGEKSNSPATIIKGVDKAVRNRITSLRLAGVCKHTKAMETWFSVR
ncbi:uncharacterized protein LOC108808437 [Raphanus sativus]|uniref:Uncharacterized protein LOC108808437 n=1 Tax=Raphanus sativus TaxID=3726 RepID=A0A6J0JKC3_RAPSA|nr:uncharacterized protein LOC108808437 [Raphanus sativus]